MKTILRIDAVPQKTKALCKGFADRFIEAQGAVRLLHRDLTKTPTPRVNRDWLRAQSMPAARRGPFERHLLSHSDMLLAEIAASDMVVISAALTASGLSPALRGWTDQISRYGHEVVRLDDAPRRVVLVLKMSDRDGEIAQGAVRALRSALGAIGLNDVFILAEEESSVGDESDGPCTQGTAQARLAT